jgi:hypothetical protein
MKYSFSIIMAIAVIGIAVISCQKQREDLSKIGTQALTISSPSTKIDSLIVITVKNNYPSSNHISQVEVLDPLGVSLGVVDMGKDSGAITVRADSIYRFGALNTKNQLQLDKFQFLVRDNKLLSQTASILINPAIVWTPYVLVKDQTGKDTIKYISNVSYQTIQPVFMKYTISSGINATPQIKVGVRYKTSSTQWTWFNYRTFNYLTDTATLIGGNYSVSSSNEIGYTIIAQCGAWKDSVECMRSDAKAQQINTVWSYNNLSSAAVTLNAASPYFNVLSGSTPAAPSAGCVQFVAPKTFQAISSADTTVTIAGYTGDDSYKAYSGNDAYKAYTKYLSSAPGDSYTNIAAKNGVVVHTVIKKNNVVMTDTWGIFYVNSSSTTAGSENVNVNFRYNPKSY